MDQFTPGSVPDPMVSQNSDVWPPPPTGQFPAAQTLAVCPFKWIYRRAPGPIGAKACVADLREGVLQFDTEGVIIQGKAVPRAEIRTLVLVPCILLSLLIAVIANSLMEYAFRHDEYLGVRWADVKEILLAPDKQQACVIYEAPNYAGKIKTFSLAFTPTPGSYDLLAQAARQYAPVTVSEGRLKNATTPLAWTALALLLLITVGFIALALHAPNH